jgi:uncharacterized protein YerC
MAKVSRRHLNENKLAEYVNYLWSAFALMPTKVDLRLLFNDLITRTEKEMLAKRFQIARRLLDQCNYDEIQRELNVTSGTVATVSDVLAKRGEGFRMAHKKLNAIEQNQRDTDIRRRKDMENPFRMKSTRKTLLGAVIKAGLKHLDKTISGNIKKKSASEHLPL